MWNAFCQKLYNLSSCTRCALALVLLMLLLKKVKSSATKFSEFDFFNWPLARSTMFFLDLEAVLSNRSAIIWSIDHADHSHHYCCVVWPGKSRSQKEDQIWQNSISLLLLLFYLLFSKVKQLFYDALVFLFPLAWKVNVIRIHVVYLQQPIFLCIIQLFRAFKPHIC